MTNFVPSNAGLDWFTVQSAAELPNVSGAAIQSADVVPGARAYVADVGLYICETATAGAAVWRPAIASGSGVVVGAQRVLVGTWGVTLAAAQTDNGLDIGGATDGGIRVIRAGVISGIAAVASAAPSVADVTVAVFKNGTVTALTVTFTAGVTTSASATGSVTVAAGDILTVKYTSGAIGNTPVMTAQVELTYS